MAEKIKGSESYDMGAGMRHVGTIQGARGMRGEMKVLLITAHPVHLASLESLYLEAPGSPSIPRIPSSNTAAGLMVLENAA